MPLRSSLQGYCNNGVCQRFPIAPGEFGSKFTSPQDLEWVEDLAKYFNVEGTDDGQHNRWGTAGPSLYLPCAVEAHARNSGLNTV